MPGCRAIADIEKRVSHYSNCDRGVSILSSAAGERIGRSFPSPREAVLLEAGGVQRAEVLLLRVEAYSLKCERYCQNLIVVSEEFVEIAWNIKLSYLY